MKKIKIIVAVVVFLSLSVWIALRWKAWFVNPAEPQWSSDTLTYRFYGFGEDSLRNFVYTQRGWQDKKKPLCLKILLLGDVHNTIQHCQWMTMYKRHPDIDCYAQLGDMVERNYFYYFQLLAQELNDTPFDGLPIINCPGNHEYRKGLIKSLSENWKQTFHQPHNGPIGFEGTSYYVDFPHLRYIVINTTGLQHLIHFTRVQTWVAATIKNAQNKFVVVMMHHPIYSCGMGRNNLLIRFFFKRVLQKADLVFCGHDHNYARRLPFVNTNSSTKYYLNKINEADERIACGVQLYNLLAVTKDTMTMQTLFMDSGREYDKVQIVRTDRGKERSVFYDNQVEETILLPDKYKTKPSRKVREFLRRRSSRGKR